MKNKQLGILLSITLTCFLSGDKGDVITAGQKGLGACRPFSGRQCYVYVYVVLISVAGQGRHI